MRTERTYLERTIREFIRQGCNTSAGFELLAKGQVIPAKDSASAPSGLFATVLYVGESRSRPTHFQSGDHVTISQGVEIKYQVQFFRQMTRPPATVYLAQDAAKLFVDFAESHAGSAWASNAITDGKLHKVQVYPSQYDNNTRRIVRSDTIFDPSDFDSVTYLSAELPMVGDDGAARAKMYLSRNNKIESGEIVNPGSDYSYSQRVDLSGLTPVSGSIHPFAVASGKGFAVKHPIMIEQVDEIEGTDFEARAVIELDVCLVEDRQDAWSAPVGIYEIDEGFYSI